MKSSNNQKIKCIQSVRYVFPDPVIQNFVHEIRDFYELQKNYIFDSGSGIVQKKWDRSLKVKCGLSYGQMTSLCSTELEIRFLRGFGNFVANSNDFNQCFY